MTSMHTLKTLDDIDLSGKTVFVRVDLNVPIHEGQITDTTRIDACIPTLQHVLSSASKMIVASHLGRPKHRDEQNSLAGVGEMLAAKLDKEVILAEEHTWKKWPNLFDHMDHQSIILLENIRYHPAETSSQDRLRQGFAYHLSTGVDAYVFDAFGVAHRKHSSVYDLPQCIGYEHCVAGRCVEKEYQVLNHLLHGAQKPLALVMGGSKIKDKLGAILALLPMVDDLIIGGAMAVPFLKATHIHIGDHDVSTEESQYAKIILRNTQKHNITVHLPKDHVLGSSFSPHTSPLVSKTAAIDTGSIGLDIGPQTKQAFCQALTGKQTIIWNGPMGVYEWPSFQEGSYALAHAIASSPAHTVVGGGDSVAVLQAIKQSSHISHISTGGGAMLEFFSNPNLHGFKALKSSE